MGVKDLWQLLAPIGRRVSVETLEGKTFAIDMSIWMTQFIKAMRDEEGKMLKNAHIIGTLRRILKLLFHRIKPVFVFDGATPILKLRVIQSRRKTHERHESNRKAAVHRLILAQLKQQLTKSAEQTTVAPLAGGDDQQVAETGQNFAAGFKPVTARRTDTSASTDQSASIPPAREMSVVDDASFEWTDGSDLPKTKTLEDAESSSDDDDPMWNLPEKNEDLNVDVLSSLPPHIRKRIIEDARRRERMKSRSTYMPVADNPTLYSQTQLANFLATSKLNRRFEEAQKKAEGASNDTGTRIAADGKKKYSYTSQHPSSSKQQASSSSSSSSFGTKASNILADENQDSENMSDDDYGAYFNNRRSGKSHFEKVAINNNLSDDDDDDDENNMDSAALLGQNTTKFRRLQRKTVSEQQNLVPGAADAVDRSYRTPSESQPSSQLLQQSYTNDVDIDEVEIERENVETGHLKLGKDVISDDDSSYGGGFMVEDDAVTPPASKLDSSLPQSLPEHAIESRSNGASQTIDSVQVVQQVSFAKSGRDVEEERAERDGREFLEIMWETDDIDGQDDEGEHRDDEDYGSEDVDVARTVDDGVMEVVEPAQNMTSTSTVVELDMSAFLAAAGGSHFKSTTLVSLLDLPVEEEDARAESSLLAVPDAIVDVVDIASEDVPSLHAGPQSSSSVTAPITQRSSYSQLAPTSQVDAMTRAVATASSMADWAGRAVRRALKEHMTSSTNSTSHVGSVSSAVASSSSSSTTLGALLPRSSSPPATVDLHSDLQQRDPEHTPEKAVVSLSVPVSQHWSEDATKLPSKKNVSWSSSGPEVAGKDEHGTNRATSASSLPVTLIKEENIIEIDESMTSSQSRYAEDYNISDEEEEENLDITRRRLASSARDAERVTEDMKEEVLRLIQAFDFPYIVAPFEAEAQCAVLEQLGLVDGVITEDSDALLFGAKAVYKNIFNDRKFVEVYLAKDAEEEMGLTRDDLIALAFFLGSDYTEGVNGVGIVNAMEILQAFPMKEAYGGPLEGLARFRKWLEGYDFAKDIIEELERKRSRAQTKVAASKTKGQKGVTGRGRKSKGGDRKRRGGYSTRGISDSESEEDLNEGDAEEGTEDEEDNGDAADSLKVNEETTDEGSVEISLTDLEKKMVNFDKRHKHGRSKWTVPASFPDPKVAQAYYHPNANRSEEKFCFDQPSRSKVRRFCRDVLGWTEAQMDAQIDPVLQKFAERSNGIQTRIDSHYMMTYNDDTRFAKIASDRLREAVVQITGKRTALSLGVVGLESEKRSKSSSRKKAN